MNILETIKLVFENPFFVLIILSCIFVRSLWIEGNYSGSNHNIKILRMPVPFKIVFSTIGAFLLIVSILALLVTVKPAPDIQNQTLYKQKDESFFVLNLDKVGQSAFFKVISFYVFQRNPDLYIGIMEFPSGSKKEAYSGKFKDYSVHGLCEGDVTVSRNGSDEKVKSFQLSFDPKSDKKSRFCQEPKPFEVTEQPFSKN